MYDDHYGLTGRPFQLTPDPKFWFDTATHRKAMAYLGYGLSQGEGFVVITGDPGVGKTTLMGHLLGEIDRERLNVIKIVSTQLRPEDLLRLVCQGLGIDSSGLNKAEMLGEIERGLHTVARSGRRTLVVVDEAQSLPIESLEELRMLSNFQAGGYPLLQIFLLGQPEFRLTLSDPRLEQLRQRVIAMHHLDPMQADEVEPYLIHRLSCVGWRGKPRFTNDAVAAIHRWSGGSPRRINQLASRVLLFGAVEEMETFGANELAAVIADLNEDTPVSAYRPAPIATPAAFAPPPPAPVAEPEPYELTDVAPMAMGAPVPPPHPQPHPSDPVPLRPAFAAHPPVPAPASDDTLQRRITDLETQLRDQDEALRRVLGLLVDWVEQGESQGRRPDLSAVRGNVA
ncbi:XrtA/PEP-CTERM system-associated ATPase [Sphingomonas kyeonggiensis]|uniref:Putative secretion ATPase (PEP-CTERM system associated) n=1 Tax=Sphingomonas kyeonggiensis TaxID=1268553 RepID=A0A7W6JRJ8_9SPHN|nr:XrtA/PEP-CTERM system-associated ATPase [Sphingomonas kyeonggiensis]MBB4097187.1 putative secretion ATPase (PEP-CTERM system associated) [Sphingomonas kyeonggiensis]